MASKEIKGVIEYVEKHGFVLIRHNKHFIFKKGELTMTVSSTPGDKHALHNVKRNLRAMNITPL